QRRGGRVRPPRRDDHRTGRATACPPAPATLLRVAGRGLRRYLLLALAATTATPPVSGPPRLAGVLLRGLDGHTRGRDDVALRGRLRRRRFRGRSLALGGGGGRRLYRSAPLGHIGSPGRQYRIGATTTT